MHRQLPDAPARCVCRARAVAYLTVIIVFVERLREVRFYATFAKQLLGVRQRGAFEQERAQLELGLAKRPRRVVGPGGLVLATQLDCHLRIDKT